MKHILLLLITLSPFTAGAQKAVNRKHIDSLLKALPQAKHDTDKMHILDGLVNNYSLTTSDSVQVYAEMMLSLANRLHDKFWQADANYHIGYAYYLKKDNKKALQYLNLSINMWREIGNERHIISVLNAKGDVYCEKLKYRKALDTLFAAAAMQEAIDKDGLGYIYSRIGYVYICKHEYYMAQDYYMRSIALYKINENKVALAWASYDLSTVYQKQREYTDARHLAGKALKLAKEIDDGELANLSTQMLENIRNEIRR